MKRVLALALFALSCPGIAKADVIPGSQTTVAGWRMGAYDRDGKFSHCAMSAPYKSGITMVFSVSDDFSWRVGWAHSTWRFKTGQGVDLTLFVDNVGPFSLRAEAQTESLAVAELPAREALFDLMRNGNRMTVRTHGNTYAFNLDGTYAALTEILKCVVRHAEVAAAPPGRSNSATPSPPSRSSVPTTPPPPPTGHTVDRLGKSKGIRLVLDDGIELKAQAVFEKVSGAVFLVKAEKNLGSAVAISERELLTNCHVLGSSSTAILERDGRRSVANVTSRHPIDDRCVLTSDTPMAKWVLVRPFSDIKVGERAFSIGAPQGFELTIAEGIVSAKRIIDGDRLLQTSAPISRGSSGGGLFDAQGHLLGITTWMRKDAQNLNFAIAAEEYAN